MRLWDVARHRQVGRPLIGAAGPLNAVGAVAFSPDGTTLAAGTNDVIRLWNVASRHQIGPPLDGAPELH